jgi:hypothetical protein
MTLARDAAEAALIGRALEELSRLALPVAVTDGGSPERLLTNLRGLAGVHVQTASAPGLVSQVRGSLTAARGWGPRRILYTEPDKAEFFTAHLRGFLATAAHEHPDASIVMASRSPDSFATYPVSQQSTERALNAVCAELTGLPADYTYGPFLLDPALVDDLDHLPPDLGWGWRTYLFAVAHRRGLRVESIEGDFACPESQRADTPAESAHRLRQLAQNVTGLARALEMHVVGT